MNRRRFTIQDHADWQHSLLRPEDYDAIDEAAAEFSFPQRRKSSEVSRLEAILDDLAKGEGKDGSK